MGLLGEGDGWLRDVSLNEVSTLRTWRILRTAELMLVSVSRKTSLPQIRAMMSSLQLERPAGAAQLIGGGVELEIVCESHHIFVRHDGTTPLRPDRACQMFATARARTSISVVYTVTESVARTDCSVATLRRVTFWASSESSRCSPAAIGYLESCLMVERGFWGALEDRIFG